jgi:hypothetical protein
MLLLGIMVDAVQAVKFAMDIARGMQYLHSLDPFVPRLYIKSSHIMVRIDFLFTITSSLLDNLEYALCKISVEVPLGSTFYASFSFSSERCFCKTR